MPLGKPRKGGIKPVLNLIIEDAVVRVGYWTALGAPFWEVRFSIHPCHVPDRGSQVGECSGDFCCRHTAGSGLRQLPEDGLQSAKPDNYSFRSSR